jgi:hypothetical protein
MIFIVKNFIATSYKKPTIQNHLGLHSNYTESLETSHHENELKIHLEITYLNKHRASDMLQFSGLMVH